MERSHSGSSNEKKPKIDREEIPNQILRIGHVWALEGTPWWTFKTMTTGIEEEYYLRLGTSIGGPLSVLMAQGSIVREEGGLVDEDIPIKEVPPMPELKVEAPKNYASYFKTTQTGKRRRVEEGEEQAPSFSPNLIPEGNQ